MKRIFILLLLFSIALVTPLLFCQIIGGFDACKFFTDDYYSYAASAAIHVGIFSAAMFFLWEKNLNETLNRIGFPGNIGNNIIYAIAGLAVVFAALLVFDVVATALGIDDEEKIVEKVSSLPWYILLFAILLAPISEELFFRAFLVPRIGILFSSVAFGLVHVAYGSMMEILGATLIGIILALIFKLSRSITPCLLIHIIYNLISILAIKLLT